jgi:HlyD family secretion protein
MQVDTNISESDIGSVTVGDKATFSVEAFPGRYFEGAVTQVRQAPQTIQNVVTYNAVVDAKNPDLLLKPGMTATLRITTDRRDDVIRVPESALRYIPSDSRPRGQSARGEGGTRGGRGDTARDPTVGNLWVLSDGKPRRVRVKTGLADENFVEVVNDSIAVGDQVIVGERGEAGRQTRQGQTVLRFMR